MQSNITNNVEYSCCQICRAELCDQNEIILQNLTLYKCISEALGFVPGGINHHIVLVTIIANCHKWCIWMRCNLLHLLESKPQALILAALSIVSAIPNTQIASKFLFDTFTNCAYTPFKPQPPLFTCAFSMSESQS